MSHKEEWEAAQKTAASAAPGGGGGESRKDTPAVAGGPVDGGGVVRWLLYVIAILMIAFALTLTPESAIHEIYQLNLISTGLILIAASGVWGAVSALAGRFNRRR